ncbi:MAG: (2Fe-2S)-binding protein [Aquificota bacterium]|nr:MAG: (2Fe-2S)-binding protein [Aquificota bacterium]
MYEEPEVCICLRITLSEILEAIENGAKNIKDIQNITKAGTVGKMCVSQENDPYCERSIYISQLLK